MDKSKLVAIVLVIVWACATVGKVTASLQLDELERDFVVVCGRSGAKKLTEEAKQMGATVFVRGNQREITFEGSAEKWTEIVNRLRPAMVSWKMWQMTLSQDGIVKGRIVL